MGKSIARTILLVIAGCFLVFLVVVVLGGAFFGLSISIRSSSSPAISLSATPSASLNVDPNPTISPFVSDVPVGAITTKGIQDWRVASNSNRQLAQCLADERINFAQVRTLNYTNGIPGAQASVSWIEGINAPPDYFTSAIQHCAAAADQLTNLTEMFPGDGEASATMSLNGNVRRYATAAGIDGLMVLAFWTQPDAAEISPSPASSIVARAIALYKASQLGVRDPKLVQCLIVRERPIVPLPAKVRALIRTKFATLKQVRILDKYTSSIGIEAESVTPHICLYSDGRQVEYAGKVPTTATEAVMADVEHAPDPVFGNNETFVWWAKIPNKGWILFDEGTAP
jgi:hypothetical protein